MYYGGIDAHLKYLTIAVVDKHGVAVLERSVDTRCREQVLEVLEAFRPLQVVVESCPFWPWIYDTLTAAGIQVRLAHAKQLRAIASAAQKNDEVDALLLARMLATDLIPLAYARERSAREIQRLLRHRLMLVRHRTAAANRIHAQLHQSGLGIKRERLLRREGLQWLKEQARPCLEPEQWGVIQSQLCLIERINSLLRPVQRRIEDQAQKNATARLLRSIPGIGPFRSLLLATELGPIARFARAEKLVCYAGLAPTTRSSGGHTRHGSLPAGANRWVRRELISAIPSHLKHAPESWLSEKYEHLRARLGWRVARVAAARQLTRAVYRMLRSGESWESRPRNRGVGASSNSRMQLQTASTID